MSNSSYKASDNHETESVISLPMSLQKMIEVPTKNFKRNQAMTMKELDCKLNALRRENFDLKLRLYLEKQNKGHVKADTDPIFIKETKKRENVIKEYKQLLDEKDAQILKQTDEFERLIQDKDFEIQLLIGEKDALSNELKIISSICQSFKVCLNDMRNFWITHSQNTILNNDLTNSFHHWLNTSETLLNSASILINNEYNDETFDEKTIPSSYINHQIQSKKSPFDNFCLQDYDAKEYSLHMQRLYNASSESEDDWSEPDRQVSKSRIGLSSFGLISEIDDKSPKRNKRCKKTGKVNQSVQTMFELFYSDDMLKSNSKKQQNKKNQTDSSFSDHFSQTDSIKMTNQSIQTNFQNEKHDRYVETEEAFFNTNFTPKDKTVKEVETQTDFRSNHFNSTFTDNNQTLFPQGFENHLKKNKSSTPQTLYTYKAILSPLNESHSSESTPIAHYSIYDQKPLQTSKKKHNSFSSSNCKSNESQSYDQFKVLQNLNVSSNLSSFDKKKFPINKFDKVSTNGDTLISSSSSIYSSLSDSYYQQKHISPIKLTKQNLKSEIKEKLMSNLRMKMNDLKENEMHEFSSPDLGIGDSDQDLNSSLQAIVKLGYYQLLCTILNKISSNLNSLDKLNKDKFLYQFMHNTEYIKQVKPFLNNLKQTMNCSKSIEDETSALNQYEDIKRLKESIEKVITQQLNKTDKLLKKAKLNIKNY